MGTQMATSGACILKAGANVGTNFTGVNAEANWDDFLIKAEGVMSTASRKNWSGAYTSTSDDVKGILADTVTNLAAIYAISNDMSGFTSRGEAESMVNILRDGALRNIQYLRDKKSEDFIDGA